MTRGSAFGVSFQEALRLAETYAGSKCPHIAAGPTRAAVVSPSTFFGSGAVDAIRQRCSSLLPDKCALPVDGGTVHFIPRNLTCRIHHVQF